MFLRINRYPFTHQMYFPCVYYVCELWEYFVKQLWVEDGELGSCLSSLCIWEWNSWNSKSMTSMCYIYMVLYVVEISGAMYKFHTIFYSHSFCFNWGCEQTRNLFANKLIKKFSTICLDATIHFCLFYFLLM